MFDSFIIAFSTTPPKQLVEDFSAWGMTRIHLQQ
jgi:hypothetical protein